MRDVIVIGAGGGGPVVAKELAARGLDVLLLEAGPRHANPRREWTHYENDANNPLTGFFRFGPADRTKPAWFRETNQNSFLWQLSGVGGTTQHYYGNYPRAYPGVFQGYAGADRGAYDTEHVFPFTYKEMVPYFEWVEHTAPVQTAAMGTKEEIYFRGCETLGIPVQTTKDAKGFAYRPQENAILQPGGNAGRTSDRELLVYPKATGCTFCGFCFQGCMQPVNAPRNQFAKRSTDNSYVPMALTAEVWAKAGRPITLITDAFVNQVHYEEKHGTPTATGVTWRDTNTGELHREDATVVVMSAGCTENPRLWLNSELPNPNDWVGRGYTDHFFDWVLGTFDEYTGNSKGVGSSARCDFPGHGGLENVGLPPALEAFTLALSDSGVRGAYANGRGKTGNWDGPTGRPLGKELLDIMSHGIDRLLNVLVITDDDVEAQNRVVRSALPADRNGPVAKVEFHGRQRSARTLANREFMARKAAELLKGAGAKKIYRIDWAPLILHVQSSMRMGTSENNSVLDANGEARWVKRLFIADNSALSNGLGGPNPTLSNQALSTRTAEKIFRLYFGGDPWVGKEAPVVSTDHRISVRLGQLGL
ncbi:GMC family oxidoreductase N-terminal domain-containing protein [Fodinicola acaciae]|uniref:GMC family oxidoreductase N-terminal domain-containing protein n=1 Tax=Fodinicola acaciae TaxID=2681555 RepID=UPI0013D0146B|nr:GMC family oxidoreductase N-terminal domain-containing protein [Fodinicola acaciae]